MARPRTITASIYILSISDDVIYLTTDTQFTTETNSDLVITTDSVRTISNSPELTFGYNESSEKNTIVRDSGSWTEDGFSAGEWITISGTENNDGEYLISSISTNGLTLYLDPNTPMTYASGQQGSVKVETGDLNVGASLSYPEGDCKDKNGRYCSAVADSSAAGGALIGVYATTSTIINNSTVQSTILDDSAFDLIGNLLLAAINNSQTYAYSSGKWGGIIAAGGNVAEVTSNSTTESILGSDVSVTADGLFISAYGDEDNYAESFSGSGGLISGAAAESTTNNNSVTRAIIQNSPGDAAINVGDFYMTVTHIANFNAKADTTHASAVGFSGAWATNYVDAVVKGKCGHRCGNHSRRYHH